MISLDMNLQPILENELVLIRPLSNDDYNELYRAAADPIIWEQHTTTDRWLPDGFKNFFEESIQSKGALVIINKATNTIIGSSRYHIDQGTSDAVEIGWSFLTKAYWGGAYNRSFKSLMIEHALQSKTNVLFLIAFDNLRSQKATEKLGAQQISKVDYPQYFTRKQEHLRFLINRRIWERP